MCSVFCFSVVGKAFAVATAVVFGGATLLFGMAVSKLQLQNVSTDILSLVPPNFPITV